MVGVRARRLAAALLAAAAVLGAGAACGIADAGESTVAGKDSLVIGVNGDQPGLGERQGDGSFAGFDVDVAKEIARRLGVPAANVTFRRVTSATREKVIQDGDVDLVVASYSVTPERKVDVSFAGPYYVAHQDILVRKSDAGEIRSIHDLKGRRLCRVAGSVSFPRVHDEQGVAALPVDADGYAGCLSELTGGRLDAVSTDDLILAGPRGEGVRERPRDHGGQRAVHRRAVRRRHTQGRRGRLRGGQQGHHRDVPGRHRAAAAEQMVPGLRAEADHDGPAIRGMRLTGDAPGNSSPTAGNGLRNDTGRAGETGRSLRSVGYVSYGRRA
ncbi:transporter substrate-binding domain-containing protein [Actinomadura madurae]|uniref:transporter substrate-binding domain-containing protein n=1 Tax=Actinomadura madurae TaxID=1993 RepID=UPI003556D7E6